MAVVDELVTILGVDIAKDAMTKLKSFSGAVEGVAKKMKIAGAVVTGAAAGFGAFLRVVVNDAAELDKLSQATGLSAEALQEWDYAAKSMNLDAKSLRSDIEKLTKTMSSPIPGQFNQNLAMMGISVRDASGSLKTADGLLLDMADKFKSMSQQRAMQWADKIGVSRDTMLLLRQGKVGVEELRKEAHKLGGIIPNESIKRAAEFKKQVSELTFALRGIAAQAAIATIPALTKIVSAFKEFIATNREWIQLGLESLMGGIVAGFDRFWKAIKKVGDFFKPLKDTVKSFLPEMSGMEWVTHLVTGALMGLAIVFAPLLLKIALIGAAIAAAALIFEDFFVFLNGGESVIGDLFKAFEERWPDLFNALKQLVSWFKDNIGPIVKTVGGVIKKVLGAIGEIIVLIMDRINAIAGPIAEFFGTFKENFPALYEGLKKLAEIITDVLGGAFDVVVAIIKGVINLIFDLLEGAGVVIKGIAGAANWVLGKLGFGKDDTNDGNELESFLEPEQIKSVAASVIDGNIAAGKAAAVGATTANQTQIKNDNDITINIKGSDPELQQKAENAITNTLYGTPSGSAYAAPVAG